MREIEMQRPRPGGGGGGVFRGGGSKPAAPAEVEVEVAVLECRGQLLGEGLLLTAPSFDATQEVVGPPVWPYLPYHDLHPLP
jgi:hypothetical protein